MADQFNYARSVATAQRMIRKFGSTVSIVAIPAAIAPANSWQPPIASIPSRIDTTGVFLDYELKFIDGTVIQRGDQKVLIAATGLTLDPNLTGWLERGTQKWNIVSVKPLNPGNTTILYIIQVRQ